MPYYSIAMVSIGIMQLWLSLLAQGLLQSVPSLQVSAWGNAILQIVMVSVDYTKKTLKLVYANKSRQIKVGKNTKISICK